MFGLLADSLAMFGLLADSFSFVTRKHKVKSPRLTQKTRLLQISLDLRVIFDQWPKLHLGLDTLSNQKILKGV